MYSSCLAGGQLRAVQQLWVRQAGLAEGRIVIAGEAGAEGHTDVLRAWRALILSGDRGGLVLGGGGVRQGDDQVQ